MGSYEEVRKSKLNISVWRSMSGGQHPEVDIWRLTPINQPWGMETVLK
jgi:hypothetical protein